MPTVVVPFRGAGGKSRLEGVRPDGRASLGLAMRADVLAACRAVGEVYLVTPIPVPAVAATLVADEGRGQAVAVQAGLNAALAAGEPSPYLVVNADLPCVTAR